MIASISLNIKGSIHLGKISIPIRLRSPSRLTGRRGQIRFPIFKFSACQKTILHYDWVGMLVLTKSILWIDNHRPIYISDMSTKG